MGHVHSRAIGRNPDNSEPKVFSFSHNQLSIQKGEV